MSVISETVAQRAIGLSAIRGFKDPNDYLVSLLDQDEADANCDEEMEDVEEIKRLIQEGLDSGPSQPITPEFWKNLHDRLDR